MIKAITAPIMIWIPVFLVFFEAATIPKPTKRAKGLAIIKKIAIDTIVSDIKTIFLMPLD